MNPLSGLRDKLYWRPVAGRWHCFKKADEGFMALCGAAALDQSGGQSIARPPAVMRCGICDGKEMDRRGWEESGPERAEWREFPT